MTALLGACASAPPAPAGRTALAEHAVVRAEPTVAPAPAVATPDDDTDRKPRVVITETSIELIENVGWVADSTTMIPEDVHHLDFVARSIFGNESIRRVGVQVYIGDGVVADRDERQRLATDRANVIVDALVARGVDRDRLVAIGQIDYQPEMNPTYVVLERGE
jgi:outer membrane protein OmpA-like peptidoglycan-associated protein